MKILGTEKKNKEKKKLGTEKSQKWAKNGFKDVTESVSQHVRQ